jgi:hypothetical protein
MKGRRRADRGCQPQAANDARWPVPRLWRATNPNLSTARRETLVRQLMDARRAVKAALKAKSSVKLRTARAAVDAAKVALGERGPPWWKDGAKDFNRHPLKNTPYARKIRR